MFSIAREVRVIWGHLKYKKNYRPISLLAVIQKPPQTGATPWTDRGYLLWGRWRDSERTLTAAAVVLKCQSKQTDGRTQFRHPLWRAAPASIHQYRIWLANARAPSRSHTHLIYFNLFSETTVQLKEYNICGYVRGVLYAVAAGLGSVQWRGVRRCAARGVLWGRGTRESLGVVYTGFNSKTVEVTNIQFINKYKIDKSFC